MALTSLGKLAFRMIDEAPEAARTLKSFAGKTTRHGMDLMEEGSKRTHDYNPLAYRANRILKDYPYDVTVPTRPSVPTAGLADKPFAKFSMRESETPWLAMRRTPWGTWTHGEGRQGRNVAEKLMQKSGVMRDPRFFSARPTATFRLVDPPSRPVPLSPIERMLKSLRGGPDIVAADSWTPEQYAEMFPRHMLDSLGRNTSLPGPGKKGQAVDRAMVALLGERALTRTPSGKLSFGLPAKWKMYESTVMDKPHLWERPPLPPLPPPVRETLVKSTLPQWRLG